VIATDAVRTHSPRKRYGRGQVHSFGNYLSAKRYRSELVHAYPGESFRIVHTVVMDGGDVYSEVKSVSEDDF
jgi:hypothetical protein